MTQKNKQPIEKNLNQSRESTLSKKEQSDQKGKDRMDSEGSKEVKKNHKHGFQTPVKR